MAGRRLVWLLAGLGGCGGTRGADLTATRCGPIASLALPTTQLGQSARLFVQITNRGGEPAAGLAPSIDGGDASELAVGDNTTCSEVAELAPGGFCVVEVALAPRTAGAKQAVLHVGSLDLPIVATATVPTADLVASVANLDFLAGSPASGPGSFVIANRGTSTITLAAPPTVELAGGVLGVRHSCPALAPGDTCTVEVNLAQTESGCMAAPARIASDTGTIELPVSSEYIAVPEVHVVPSVPTAVVHGRVRSDPVGIDCDGTGSGCRLRVDGDTITYSAAATAGDHFNGWDQPMCGMDPDCRVDVGPFVGTGSATAFFAAAGARAIDIAIAGDGFGVVHAGDTQVCLASCTVYVAPGTRLALEAAANSQLAGWGGDCSGTDPSCDLGAIDTDRHVTVRFAKQAHEIETRTTRMHGAFEAALLPGGDLIVAGGSVTAGSQLSRRTAAGEAVWRHAITGSIVGIAVNTNGTIYVLSSLGSLFHYDADGTLRWRVELHLGKPTAIAALGANLVVMGASALEARSFDDGAPLWTTALAQPPTSLAVSSTGLIALTEGAEVHRFSSTGTALLPVWTAPGPAGPWRIAYDAAGNLGVLSEARYATTAEVATPAKLTKLAPTGAPLFSVDVDPSSGTGGGSLVAIGAHLVVVRMHHHFVAFPAGAYIESYDAAGAREWRVDKWGEHVGAGYAVVGFVGGPLLAAPDGTALLLVDDTRIPLTPIERFAP